MAKDLDEIAASVKKNDSAAGSASIKPPLPDPPASSTSTTVVEEKIKSSPGTAQELWRMARFAFWESEHVLSKIFRWVVGIALLLMLTIFLGILGVWAFMHSYPWHSKASGAQTPTSASQTSAASNTGSSAPAGCMLVDIQSLCSLLSSASHATGSVAKKVSPARTTTPSQSGRWTDRQIADCLRRVGNDPPHPNIHVGERLPWVNEACHAPPSFDLFKFVDDHDR